MTAALGLSDETDGHESYATETLGKRLQGSVIAGTYRLGRCIGSGASSHVFEAEHLRLGRKFAVKVLRAELDGKRAAQRFRREAQAIARLRSEHIVSVVDCGELDDRTPFLVMELLEGESLRQLLAHAAPFPARRALHLAVEVCQGLNEVHRAGLVHRDLKPENLFIARRSTGQDWCKILDFGVAKMEASVGTAQGVIVGTVRYMAPEQLVDSTVIGPATDIHAVGAILFECLTGRPLVSGASVQEAMYQIINASPRELVGDAKLPPRVEQLILSCLEKAPERRPASAAELAKLLAGAVAAPVSPLDTTLVEDADARPPPSAAGSRRKYIWLALGAFTTTLLGALVGWQASPRPLAVASPASSPSMTRPALLQRPSTTQETLQATAPAVASAEQRTSSAPSRSASVPPYSAVTPAPRRKPQSPPAPTPTTEPVDRVTTPLDRFDRANPYGD